LEKNSTLQWLNLHNNQIGAKGAKALAPFRGRARWD